MPRDKVDLVDASFASFLAFRQTRDSLYENIVKEEHARYLIELAFKGDVEFSFQMGLLDIVPLTKTVS